MPTEKTQGPKHAGNYLYFKQNTPNYFRASNRCNVGRGRRSRGAISLTHHGLSLQVCSWIRGARSSCSIECDPTRLKICNVLLTTEGLELSAVMPLPIGLQPYTTVVIGMLSTEVSMNPTPL